MTKSGFQVHEVPTLIGQSRRFGRLLGPLLEVRLEAFGRHRPHEDPKRTVGYTYLNYYEESQIVQIWGPKRRSVFGPKTT